MHCMCVPDEGTNHMDSALFMLIDFVDLRMESNEKRDVYYRLSKKHGYRARSVYKLMHIDSLHDVFKGASSVVDLCAAPGSWSQYASEKMKSMHKNGISANTQQHVVCVDVQDIAPIDGVVCIKEDITSDVCAEKILQCLGGSKADVVICDGAPEITGLHEIDEYLQSELLVSTLCMCMKIAKHGSSLVAKCFKGIYTPYIVNHFGKFYDEAMLLKPKASKATSMECFLYCKGMKNVSENPTDIDTSIECKEITIHPCGYGADAGLEYEMEEVRAD
ncbi:FtsJ-like methyltransferase [Ordospora pajunii]|uniref:FtsJ-like methyltransferase n=1 Tax=Ordospora pajunii TaxID=3039483 RepID=UPI0029528890|nr:FtsJ-like methyltransferase [Ordospora pajunii]KAH9410827.1 FtsJ-like methyltransferase [Ordospora pajunii]